MGNAYTGKFCPSHTLEKMVNEGGSLQQILLRRDVTPKDIFLGNNDYATDKTYTILYSDEIPKDNYLMLIFPCHSNRAKRILRTCNYSSISKLNREINERLKDSLIVSYDYETCKLVVATSNIIYKVYNVVGTGYIFWTNYINVVNHNNVVTEIIRSYPIFVHKDGHNIYQDVLIIKNHSAEQNTTLNVSKCRFYEPLETFLWTNEHDPRKNEVAKINVVSTKDAIDTCSDDVEDETIHESIQKEELPFTVLIGSDAETTNDLEMDFGEITIDTATPREDFTRFSGLEEIGPDEEF